MADTINVDKLKNDAFDAIDAVFSEREADTSFEEQSLEKSGPASDEFALLAEYTLALDWEYSDKELNRFTKHLDRIALKNPDKYNQSLIKILKSIINYLQRAREKAFPQTLNVITSVIDSLKNINTKGFDEAGIKLEVSSAYKEVLRLKEKILEYNKKIRKLAAEKREEKTVDIPDSELVSEKAAGPTGDFIESMGNRDINTNVLTRLDHLDEKISYLEKQNSTLKRLILDQHQGVATTPVSNINFTMEEDTDDQNDVGSFSVNEKAVFPIKEPVTIDVNDISFEPSIMPSTKKKIFTAGTGDEENIAFAPGNMKNGKPDRKEDDAEYVRCFKVGRQMVALPNDYINNIYRLPSNIKKTIYSMESIFLEDLSSLFQKLSKKMKEGLQNIPAPELKKINAIVKILDNTITRYNYAVLCSCDDTHVLVPVTGKHRNELILATAMDKTNSKISEYRVEIDGMGAIPLIIPC